MALHSSTNLRVRPAAGRRFIQLRRGPNGLEAGWYAVTRGGSATSPAISPDGRYVVVGDGSGTETGRLLWTDTEKCSKSGECQWAQASELSGAPILGSPAVLPGGEVIFWEFGADKTRDLARVSPQGHFIWETDLGGNLDWASVATVSQNQVIGSASELSYGFLGIPRPGPDFLVLLDRESGKLVAKFPLSDDSFATVSVGPWAELYVGMLGVLSLNQGQTGLAKFVPN